MHQGEIVTLIGANGAGKSTLMMTIFGNPAGPRGQRSSIDGHDITQMPTHEIARLRISQSPEGRRVFPRMTVYENLQMGASINDFAHFDEDLERMFTLFPRLKERIGQRGGTLSGGEQQMLAIARALMARPRLLLLDEPSLGLAPLIVKQIFDAIRELNRTEGLTVFLVEQNAYHALKLAHRGYVMVNGLITMSGTGKAAARRPAGARRLSRGRPPLTAGRARRHAGHPLRRTVDLAVPAGHRRHGRLGGLGVRQVHRPDLAARLAGRPLHAGAGLAVRFIHFALFEGTCSHPAVLHGRHRRSCSSPAASASATSAPSR